MKNIVELLWKLYDLSLVAPSLGLDSAKRCGCSVEKNCAVPRTWLGVSSSFSLAHWRRHSGVVSLVSRIIDYENNLCFSGISRVLKLHFRGH